MLLSLSSIGWIWKGVVDQKVEEDMSLDIFEMTTTSTREPTIELVNKELLIFKRY